MRTEALPIFLLFSVNLTCTWFTNALFVYFSHALQVSWAMGTGGSRSIPSEEEDENTEDNFRKLFTAIDFDPSRAPPPPPLGGAASGPANWGGWLAVSLNLRAPEVSRLRGTTAVRSATSAPALKQ